jgi:hypothetical protein
MSGYENSKFIETPPDNILGYNFDIFISYAQYGMDKTKSKYFRNRYEIRGTRHKTEVVL